MLPLGHDDASTRRCGATANVVVHAVDAVRLDHRALVVPLSTTSAATASSARIALRGAPLVVRRHWARERAADGSPRPRRSAEVPLLWERACHGMGHDRKIAEVGV